MQPGNAPALHSQLQDYAQYAEMPVSLDGEEVTVYHCQYAKYPVERAARALHDGLDLRPEEYDSYDELRDAIFDTSDRVEEILEETPGLTADLHDRSLFDEGQRINPTDVQVSQLATQYDGFEPADGEEHHYERYGKRRQPPETRAQFVADLLTIYHVELAQRRIADLRVHVYDEEWTEDEAQVCLYAMRDAVERVHGWSVFDRPDPSEELVEELWEMADEVGFEPQVEWVYALFILPHGARYYEPKDTLDRKLRHGMDSMMAGMMGNSDPELKWAGDTPADEVEAHREKMRDA